MSSTHPRLPNSQEEAALDSDLSLNQLVLERSQTATKTAEDIKQEELLRRAAEKKNNLAPTVARRPDANRRKKAPATATTTAVSISTNATEDDDQRQKDELALLRVVAERSAAARREEAESASKSNNPAEIGAQAFNPGDYVSEKGDTINLMAIAAQRSVDDDATPSMAATADNTALPDAAGDSVGDSVALNPASNPAAGIEYDHQTGRPMTKHSLPPGSVTPGAYSGAPGANYQAVEPVRLDVLGPSSPPMQETPQGQIEEAEVNTMESLEEKKRNPVAVRAAIAVLAVVIILAITIPLAVGGKNGESPKMDNTQVTSIDKALLPNAPNSTWESIVTDQKSLQFKAYTWLTRDPNLQTYESWQKEQRFSLATFYYACNGPKWRFKDPQAQNEWLSYGTSECGWGVFHTGPLLNGVHCSTGDRVTEIKVMEQRGFTGSVPSELSLLGSLKILDLSENIMANHLTDLLPIHESEPFQSLEALHCVNCRLVGSLPPELFEWTNLLVLDLSNNQISGPLPLEVSLMAALVDLDLGSNQFVGEVPSEVGQLTALTSLDLSRNQFVGEVPSEVGRLTALTSLDLSRNQFMGEVPSEMAPFQPK
ncbi:Leucine Rich Repeat [Seminavis robusta]|uniref:Leucine Rich Repeat n=1 Tax=Seminavis robusta TaxID=568900 RepID=A0A9N8F0X4_9STRA|nr:Leucine Rich Repeat [Seminavis robusta]|eukprot:Sro2420_g327130.1 Leucine Rich Repeat (598) ;mRNA; f:4834-6895